MVQLTLRIDALLKIFDQLKYVSQKARGDRGKMIHFLKIFFSCFYDWIYLIVFKCIIHCQVLATTWEKEKQA